MLQVRLLLWAVLYLFSANNLFAFSSFDEYTQEPQPREEQSMPYDPLKVYEVQWDSVMVYTDTVEITRVFSANSKFGEHLLPVSELETTILPPARSNVDFITVLILVCLLGLGLANYFFPLKFRETIKAVWDSRFYSQLEKEGGVMSDWVSFFLYVNFLLAVMMLLYQMATHFGINGFLEQTPIVFLFVYLIIALVAFYMAKYILLFFLAWVFKTRLSTEAYFRNILLTNSFIGLLILPLVIVYAYNPSTWLIYIALAVIAILNIYKVIRGSLLGYQRSGLSAYYLILYLCAIEIAPLILMIKLSRDYLSG